VNEEIRLFVEANGGNNVIPILLEGIPNNEASPDQEAEMAFPEALLEIMRMPLAIGYRGFNPDKDKVNKGIYDGSWFSVLANLYDISRSEIEQREKKRQARIRNYWIGGASSVTAALLAFAMWALVERDIAGKQRDEALRSQSIFLAQVSRQQTSSGRTDLGIKVALQALPRRLENPDRPWVRGAEAALYGAVAQQIFRLTLGGNRAGFGDSLQEAKISPDGTRAVLDYAAQTELWSLESGEQIKAFKAEDDSWVTHVAFSPDGRFLAIGYKTLESVLFQGKEPGTFTERGSVVEIVDARTGDLVHKFQTPGHKENHIQFSPSGNLLLVATNELFQLVDTAKWESVDGSMWEEIGVHFAPPMY
jgi:hypothetical protein